MVAVSSTRSGLQTAQRADKGSVITLPTLTKNAVLTAKTLKAVGTVPPLLSGLFSVGNRPIDTNASIGFLTVSSEKTVSLQIKTVAAQKIAAPSIKYAKLQNSSNIASLTKSLKTATLTQKTVKPYTVQSNLNSVTVSFKITPEFLEKYGIQTVLITTYHMQGFAPELNSWVAWFSTGTPDLSPTATMPASVVADLQAKMIFDSY
jgi:hypothetical protein